MPVPRRPAKATLAVCLLLALCACEQFDTEKMVETCVASALKNGEPFGNAKERTESEAQFRQYCAAAVKRKRP